MLARGSKGPDVMELQLNMMKLGYNPGSCNGFFDARTEEAVMLLQRDNNIPIIGLLNKETENLIYQLLRRMSAEQRGTSFYPEHTGFDSART